jgi:3D (Asp-Asp-Asp) domain-containing protein
MNAGVIAVYEIKLFNTLALLAILIFLTAIYIKMEPVTKIELYRYPVFIEVEKTVYKEKEVTIASINETFEVTAYTAGFESTGKTPDHKAYGITASGKKVEEWHTIACPQSMEFGTKIYIPYFGITFTCEDRGSAITEGKIDIYMANLQDAIQFGRQHLEIVRR